MKTPSPEDARLFLDWRVRGKRGEYVPSDVQRFLRRMYKGYPAWCKEQEGAVFDRTVPFGSNVRWDDLHPPKPTKAASRRRPKGAG